MDINNISVRVKSTDENNYVQRTLFEKGFKYSHDMRVDSECLEKKDVVYYEIRENKLTWGFCPSRDKTIVSTKEFERWAIDEKIKELVSKNYPKVVGLTQEIIDNYKKTTKGSAVCEVDETKMYQLTLSTLLDKGIDAREAVEIAMLTIK